MLRLTGVVVMVQAIIATPKTLVILFMKPPGASPDVSAWLLTIASGFPILVGLFLIYFPGTIANRIVSPAEQSVDTLTLQQLAFSVLGLYFVAFALFDAVYWIAKLRLYFVVFNELNYGRPLTLTPEDFAGIASTCAQFTAGALLLFGGRGLANLFYRLRSPPALD